MSPSGSGRRLAERLTTLVAALFITPPTARSAHLRSVASAPARSRVPGQVAVGLVGLLGLACLVALVRQFGFIGLLGVVIVVIALVAACIAARRSNRRWRTQTAAHFDTIVAALHDHKPQFLIHWDALGESKYQLDMWVPYLAKTELPFAVIVRNPDGFEAAAAAVAGAPVVLAEGHTEMERLLAPSVTTVFYVNNADRNNQVTRFEQLQHIQLGHGDSDKSTSSTRTFRLFDRIYVAGQAGLERFDLSRSTIPASAFSIVGRPQVEGISQEHGPISGVSTPTVLYAPTWRGDFDDSSHSSLPYAPDLISRLLERGCRVVFRPHPLTSRYAETAEAAAEIDRRLHAHSIASGTEHLFGAAAVTDLTLKECFNISHAMIADISAVISDYLYSGKPIGAFIPTGSAGEQREDGWYLFTEDPSTWSQQLDSLLSSDPLRNERLRIRDHRLANAAILPPDQLFVDTARAHVLQA